jgi:Polyketide cyclase / dehydrase and lipid transport
MPDDMLAESTANGASSADVRAFGKALPLQRGVFPRPYSLTRLPHRDITMQNVPGEGDFEHYQGVWRMQALPNCAPDGSNASRLTYAVEIKPKGLLPVKLIEGRIAADLKSNMAAIRKFVEAAELKKPRRSPVLEAQTDFAMGSVLTEGGENIIESKSAEVEVLVPTEPLPLASASTGIALIEHAGARKHGAKRRGLLRAISRLFGRSKVDSVDGANNAGAEYSSSSTLNDSDDSTALLQENRRLKDRVLFLEGEMAKANIVLRKIEELSKLD